MQNNQVVSFIKSELTNGKTKQEIVDSLIKAGWQMNVVEEAYATIGQSARETITEKNYPITKLWIFKAPIICLLISIAAFFFGYYFPYLIVAIPFYLIANPLTRANFHYVTEEKFFMVRQGIFSKKQRNLPYGVIQNVFVKQDLFDRMFGLASLSVENASQGGGKGFFGGLFQSGGNKQQNETVGSTGNKVNIPGLKKSDAEALKLVLLQRMKENPIEDSHSGL